MDCLVELRHSSEITKKIKLGRVCKIKGMNSPFAEGGHLASDYLHTHKETTAPKENKNINKVPLFIFRMVCSKLIGMGITA